MQFRSIILAALICFCVVFVGCSASSSSSEPSAPSSEPSIQTDSETEAEPDTLKIGFSKLDGFNPYLVNDELVLQTSGLVNEKLVEITPEMNVEYRIASSITSNGLSAVITLREDAMFADGTPITAQDVLASFNAARSFVTYAGSLAHVTDAQIQGNQIVVTLSRPDSLFSYLCAIPILKQSDISSPHPTPSGQYTYGSDNTLIKNPTSLFQEEHAPDTIQLVDISNFDALVSGLSVGSIDLYATTKESITTSAYTSRSTSFNMNHLVFLGVNSASSAFLGQSGIRNAISTALDREILCERAYYGAALPARGAIHPLYSCVTGKQTISTLSNLSKCEEQMEALGYKRSAADGYYRDAAGQRPQIRLLVYSDSALKRSAATLIKEQLNDAGFMVNLEETEDFVGVYSDKIAKGDFDLYIGELKLYNNMDMSPFFEKGAASFGIVQSPELLTAYSAFTANSDGAEAFETIFAQQLPWIPLCWRSGTLVVNKQVTGMIPSCSNIFYSMQSSLPASQPQA